MESKPNNMAGTKQRFESEPTSAMNTAAIISFFLEADMKSTVGEGGKWYRAR